MVYNQDDYSAANHLKPEERINKPPEDHKAQSRCLSTEATALLACLNDVPR